ncbi:MAG: ParA family protein [Spirochaetes bacterium]|nr:ParA family protein [Spirochaetota bacterium]
MMNNSHQKPLVISVVSGKGGVGKTRISTTLAKILSKNLKVLLIDFDLHNQGMTSLFYGNKGNNEFECSVFDYLNNKKNNDDTLNDKKEIKLTKLQTNLFFLPASLYATRSSQVRLEDLNKDYTSNTLSKALLKLIENVKSNYSIDCIIIDNTGIPDDFSIGSSLASDKILLITQTDSITWRGALNFHRIFLNNEGDSNKIKFIVNNIPKKYNYELIDIESQKIGQFLKNLDFEIFIPFEYGVFESVDQNVFSDANIEKSLFYKKIELLSVTILKESNLGEFISKDLEVVFDERTTLKKSLDVRFENSPQYRIQELKSRIIMSTMFAFLGIVFTSFLYPDLIPQFFKNLDYPKIIFTLMILMFFSLSIIFLTVPSRRLMRFLR